MLAEGPHQIIDHQHRRRIEAGVCRGHTGTENQNEDTRAHQHGGAVHHKPGHGRTGVQVLIEGEDNQAHQGGQHGHNDADNTAVQQTVAGGFGGFAGVAALPVGLGHQNAHEARQERVQGTHEIQIGKGPHVALAHGFQAAAQLHQAEIHLAEGKQIEDNAEDHAQNALEQIGPHHAVDAAHKGIDDENGGEQQNDGKGIGPGKHLEDFAEGFALAAHPGHHDAGTEDAAENPRQLVADYKIVDHFRHGIIGEPSRQTGKDQGKDDFGALFAQDKRQPPNAVFIAAAGVADEIARAHDGGKLGKEDQIHGKTAAADGIVGETFIGLSLHFPGDHEKHTADDYRQNPEQGTHGHSLHAPFRRFRPRRMQKQESPSTHGVDGER